MDTNVTELNTQACSSLAVRLAPLDIGPEIDWEPEHLAPSAWFEHVPFAFWIVQALRPRCLVELGTHWGVSYSAFCQAVERLGLSVPCHAVDTWAGDEHAGHYGPEVFEKVSTLNDRNWRSFSTLLRMTFDEARERFVPGEVDLLHIDGMHTYEAVAGDFAHWRDTVSDRGVVLFHDTNVRGGDFGVWRLWHELKDSHPHFEFVHGHGLGVLGIGRMVPAPLQALFSASADHETEAAVRSLFAARGAAVRTCFLAAEAGRQAAEARTDVERLGAENQTLLNVVQTVESALAARDTAFAELEGQIAVKEAELAARKQELGVRDGDLVSLRQQLARYDQQLATYNQQLATCNQQITWYQCRTDDIQSERRRCKNELNETIIEERCLSHSLEAELQELRRTHHRLLNSRSWRLTAPARWILERHPRVGRGIRNGARIGWWAVTLRYSRLMEAIHARAEVRREERLLVESGLFDKDFYLENVPTAANTDRGPVWHYLVRGWWDGCRPHPLFDGEWYRQQNADVAKSNINPLVHFIELGMREYRDPNPFFDLRWYVITNPDVAVSGVDPITHFMTIGAPRLADPSPAFSTSWYLDQNPDVAACGVNPLVHYLLTGQREGRLPRLPPPDFASAKPVTAARIECRKPVSVRDEIALFVTHSPDGYLKRHVRPYLEALAREGIGTVLIVAADRGFIEGEPDLYGLVDGLFVRSNEGFDFAAWAHVLRLHRDLYRAEILYLLNDSVIGPVKESFFHTAIERLRADPADLVGMTDNYERGWHIQSYFLALKRGVLRSYAWHQFVFDVVSFSNKDDVINSYEVRLAPTLAAAGLRTAALFPAKSRHNTTLYHWNELLDEAFPFLKIMAIRDDIPGVDRTGWRERLIDLGFDTTVMDEILAGRRISPPRKDNSGAPEPTVVPAAARERPRVAFIGPWNYDNGLGIASRGYMSALWRTGYAVNFLPMTKPFHVHQRVGTSVEYRNFVGAADVAIVHFNPEAWEPYLTDAQKQMIESAAFRVGAFIWESYELPLAFHTGFRELDSVWAPTSYCTEIFRSATGLPVHTVHFPVAVRENRRRSSEIAEVKEWLGLDTEHRLILFAFDASSFFARKNPIALVNAFQRANLEEAGWRLILKIKHSSDNRGAAEALRAKVERCPGAQLIDRPMGDDAMGALLEAAEIYASPHSSEGFGLTIAEAMALGKIVVATDYGGSHDFLDERTGFPVRFKQWQLERDEGPYAKGTVWAKVDEEHLAESLIAASSLPEDEARRLGESARQRMRHAFSPEHVAAQMQESINSLLTV